MRRWPLALALALAGPAHATPRSVLRKARADIAEGVKAARAGRNDAALARFEAAEPYGAELGELDRIRWNIGRTLEALGRPQEALAAFERCLEVVEAERRGQVEAKVAELVAQLYARLAVTCATAGTEIRVDGPGAAAEFGPCPARLERLPPGDFKVLARIGDRPFAPRVVVLTAGAQADVEVPAAGAARIDARPGAIVRLDGAEVGAAPLLLEALPPGRYALEVQDGEAIQRQVLAIQAGARAVAYVEPPADHRGTIGWSLVAGGAALALTGAWLLLSAEDLASERDDALARYDASRDPVELARLRAEATEANDDFGLRRGAGLGTLLLGLAAGGAAAWLLWPEDDAAAVSAGPGSLTFKASF
ncbi:MAG: tetratricopeptide repeat protein [Myxococcales bacterium]|nr:tetratricopeptide repeat protein [Myxococcales bacterium]